MPAVADSLEPILDPPAETLAELGLILTDVNPPPAGNGERLAFLFDTRRVRPSGLAAELVVTDEWLQRGTIAAGALCEQFVRTPYAVSFLSGGQTFILVTLRRSWPNSPAPSPTSPTTSTSTTRSPGLPRGQGAADPRLPRRWARRPLRLAAPPAHGHGGAGDVLAHLRPLPPLGRVRDLGGTG